MHMHSICFEKCQNRFYLNVHTYEIWQENVNTDAKQRRLNREMQHIFKYLRSELSIP